MRNHLYVDGVDLATFGVYISGQGAFSAPAKEIPQYDVPGRDGTVIGKSSRLLNLDVTYPAFMYANFRDNLRDLRAFLLSRSGYVRISDTYNTDEFRLGMYINAFEPDVVLKNNAGRFDLVFNCKPQRYLTSGEIAATFYGTAFETPITNPTRFPAKPLLKCYGYGALEIKNGNGEYDIKADFSDTTYSSLEYFYIDCETMQAFTESGDNLNKYVEFSLNDLQVYDAPILLPGVNKVTLSVYVSGLPGFSQLDLTPRWWTV